MFSKLFVLILSNCLINIDSRGVDSNLESVDISFFFDGFKHGELNPRSVCNSTSCEIIHDEDAVDLLILVSKKKTL